MFGIPYMADVLYPSDLLAMYKDIRLLCDGHIVSVAVNRYRNTKEDAGGTKDAEDVKNALIYLTGGKVIQACGGAERFVEVFTGKGSPGAIRIALEHLYDRREPFIRTFGAEGNRWIEVPPKPPPAPAKPSAGPKPPAQKKVMRESGAYQCAKLMEKLSRDRSAMMKAVCDKFIGLDCSGFVGNFTRMFTSKYGPNTPISNFLTAGTKRSSVDQVKPLDILVWRAPDHIAIVDGRMTIPGTNVTVFSVAQSTGPGPMIAIYQLSLRNKRFQYVAIPAIQKDGGGGRSPDVVTLNLA